MAAIRCCCGECEQEIEFDDGPTGFRMGLVCTDKKRTKHTLYLDANALVRLIEDARYALLMLTETARE